MDDMTHLDPELISVVIPMYNSAKYIAETLATVFAQTYQKIEIIVVDDGSTDNSVEVVQNIGRDIRLFPRENQGVARARNFAAEQAKGKWLAFVDSDDLWMPEKLEMQLAQIKSEKWSHTDSYYFGENQDGSTSRSDLTEQFGGQVFEKLLVNNFITTSTVMIQTELFLKFKGFDESLEACEDWQFWLDVAQHEPIDFNPAKLAKYRVHSGSTSRRARQVLPLHKQVIEHTFSQMSEPRNGLKNAALIESHMICSYIAEDSNDHRFAFSCAWQAFLRKPWSANLVKRVIRTLLNIVMK